MNKIRAIYWDLDGTLYRFGPEADSACDRAGARAALACGATESEDCLIQHYARVYNPHIIPRSLEEDPRFDRLDFHHRYHDGVDIDLVVEEVVGVREAFARSRLPHVLITHGSRPWAKQVLGKIGIRQHFPDERIFGLEDMDFSGKDVSVQAYWRILNQLGHTPTEVAMVEDSPRNLVHAHAIGMKTVLVHHGKPLVTLPEHVHAQCHHAGHVIEMLEKPLRHRALKPHCAQGRLLPE